MRLRSISPVYRLAAALGLVAAVAVALWFTTEAADEWMPTIAVDAVSLLVGLVIVDRLVRNEQWARLRPRLRPVLDLMGFQLREFAEHAATDYGLTHVDEYKPVPTGVIAVLDLWLDEAGSEDTERPEYDSPLLVEADVILRQVGVRARPARPRRAAARARRGYGRAPLSDGADGEPRVNVALQPSASPGARDPGHSQRRPRLRGGLSEARRSGLARDGGFPGRRVRRHRS
jgi:hypothetical protein